MIKKVQYCNIAIFDSQKDVIFFPACQTELWIFLPNRNGAVISTVFAARWDCTSTVPAKTRVFVSYGRDIAVKHIATPLTKFMCSQLCTNSFQDVCGNIMARGWPRFLCVFLLISVGFQKSRATATATADHTTFTSQYSATTKQEFTKPRICRDTRRPLVFYQQVG